jgi:hypothetical protein
MRHTLTLAAILAAPVLMLALTLAPVAGRILSALATLTAGI